MTNENVPVSSVAAEVVRGEQVSPEVKAEFDSLRTAFDPKAALDRLDAYGKWLFASAAVVGTLGAGLSNSAFAKLHGLSAWSFAAAVASLGMSLVLACSSLTPKLTEVRLAQLASMREAINRLFKTRQRILTGASVLFSLALALAAASPLASLVPTGGATSIHFTIDEKGTLSSELSASDLPPGTITDLRLESNVSENNSQLPHASMTVDRSGSVKLSLQLTGLNVRTDALSLVGCLKKPQGGECFDRTSLSVTQKKP